MNHFGPTPLAPLAGIRKEIAKHVVWTILETLTDDDFVNVFRFNDSCGVNTIVSGRGQEISPLGDSPSLDSTVNADSTDA